VLGGGGIGYLQLTGGSADDAGAVAVAVRPASTGSARTASPGSSASGTPSASGGTSPTAASPSRNPFRGLAVTGAPGTSGATGPAASTTAPTTAPSGTAATVAPPVTTATVTAVRTTTVTATATPVYVGLYGWTDAGLPELRVNDTAATPSPGATFGGTLVYTGTSVSGGLTCADVTSAGTARQICPGSVVKVR